MRFLKYVLDLWKKSKNQKGTTLQRRLILFFAMVVVSVILSFTLLLIVFGFTGSGRQAVSSYLESELLHISAAAEDDLGNLSVTGIHLSEQLTEGGRRLADNMGVSLEELLERRDSALLSAQMAALLSVAEQNPCGGVFLVLDAPNEADRLPGIFIKKTQPVSSASLTAKTYCLRGNADIARAHGVELMGQWQMDYDSAEIPFLETVLAGARSNPDLDLSRLYYWSGRLRLNGNSETGILLCVPLRDYDGTVYGVCGIEVSDRMFKQLYSPGENTYQSVFAIAAPLDGFSLRAQEGLIAGNSYLTGSQIAETLAAAGQSDGLFFYEGEQNTYGGMICGLKIYPGNSPYEGKNWAMAVLMPRNMLEDAIRGNSALLFVIVAALLIVSLIGCVFISRRYLHPIHQGLSSIRERAYETDTADFGVTEIDDLFAELARDIRAHQEEVEQLRAEREDAQAQAEKAQTRMDRLVDRKRQELDPEEYAVFLANLKKLTLTERRVFELYLEGKTPREITEALGFKDNTLKYHNRNIYGKLGVTSRKQMLQFAALMEQYNREEGDGAL